MTPRMDTSELLTMKTAAQEAGVSIVTLWRWCKAGRLSAVFVDGRPFLRRQDLAGMERPKRGRPPKQT